MHLHVHDGGLRPAQLRVIEDDGRLLETQRTDAARSPRTQGVKPGRLRCGRRRRRDQLAVTPIAGAVDLERPGWSSGVDPVPRAVRGCRTLRQGTPTR